MGDMPNEKSKQDVFKQVEQQLAKKKISVLKKDMTRPWGGFFVIAPSSLPLFIESYFNEEDSVVLKHGSDAPLSPKVLLVAPGARLSWQYHHRRSELWAVIQGSVGIITSRDNHQPPAETYNKGERISINKGVRHRLIGLDDWGIVAEIWIHDDPENPSDENDIVRIEDDYGR